ncbi:alpha/beta hydrolase fold domain-containing protein [Mariniphaga sediminis]|uniref:alpha/beta hydrolase fold domain-containing protein n=1 Tax=Mariniphaga sediminis TaxID=1628158 RepID=UPI003566E099
MKNIKFVITIIILSLVFKPAFIFSKEYKVNVQKDIKYGEALNDQNISQSLLMDIYQIDEFDKLDNPALILVHGGGFKNGDKRQDLYIQMANSFAKNGYVVFSINYRLASEKFGIAVLNNATDDALTALKWIKQHDKDYGINSSKIIIAGDSAGGAIAVNASFREPNDTKFAGCINLWGGLTSIKSNYKHEYGWDQPVYPLPVSKETPPTCIIHGTKDAIVPVKISKSFSEELTSIGIYNEIHILEGAPHYPESYANEFIPMMIDFANKVSSSYCIHYPDPQLVKNEIPVLRIEGLSASPDSAYKNMEIIQNVAEKCCDLGKAQVIFPKGTFVVSSVQAEKDYDDLITEKIPQRTLPEHTNYLMAFSHINNLTIDGQGCQLIFRGLIQPFDFQECKKVQIKDLTIDWERPLFSEGRVTLLKQNTLEVKVFSEYPMKGGEPILSFQSFSPKTGHLTGVCPFSKISSCKLVGEQLVRFNSGDSRFVQVGDIVIMRHIYSYKPGFEFYNCEDISVRNVTVHSLPGMVIHATRTKNIQLKHFNVYPSGNRIMSGNVDATHFYSCMGLVEIDSCYFEGMGDDATNVHGNYYTVLEKLNETTIKTCVAHSFAPTERHRDYPDVGDKVEFIRKSVLQPYSSATVVFSKFDENTRETIIQFDKPLPDDFEMHDLIANLSKHPKLKFTNNTVRDVRGRGVLVQTRGALIENNSFEYCTGQGIHVNTAYPWMESVGTRSVVIRGNKFINCGFGFTNYRDAIAVSVETEAENPFVGIHQGLTIENNVVIGHSKPAFYLSSLYGALIKGNRVISNTSAIRIECSGGIEIENNNFVEKDILIGSYIDDGEIKIN